MALSDIRPDHVVVEDGGKFPFVDSPSAPVSAKSELDITKVGTKHTPKAQGHDTYVGFPGDGITPG
jgi:hypothetical protein